MDIEFQHDWHLTPTEAAEVQKRLAARVAVSGDVLNPHIVAGADMSVPADGNCARAVVVALSYPGLEPLEVAEAEGRLDFPYIPGLLSFREAPLVLQAWRKLCCVPDLLFVDGQGMAHPRRMGIASHLGMLLDVPTIGCAKSRLCGEYDEPGPQPGDSAPLFDRGELVGMVLRTRTGSRPLFISVGHKISLENAVLWVIKCLRGHRLPEPARLAHLASVNRLQRV